MGQGREPNAPGTPPAASSRPQTSAGSAPEGRLSREGERWPLSLLCSRMGSRTKFSFILPWTQGRPENQGLVLLGLTPGKPKPGPLPQPSPPAPGWIPALSTAALGPSSTLPFPGWSSEDWPWLPDSRALTRAEPQLRAWGGGAALRMAPQPRRCFHLIPTCLPSRQRRANSDQGHTPQTSLWSKLSAVGRTG